jgi:hypothetical protein
MVVPAKSDEEVPSRESVASGVSVENVDERGDILAREGQNTSATSFQIRPTESKRLTSGGW